MASFMRRTGSQPRFKFYPTPPESYAEHDSVFIARPSAERIKGDTKVDKMNEDSDFKTPTAWKGLDLTCVHLRQLSPSLLCYKTITVLHLQDNDLTMLPSWIGQFQHLVSLDVSNNQLHSLPNEMASLCRNLRELNLRDNVLHELSNDIFGRLYRLQSLTIDNNPISTPPLHVLQQGPNGIFRWCRDHLTFPNQPAERTLTTLMPVLQEVSYVKQEGHRKISVVSYNILAELYATTERHMYCPQWALDWSYRKLRLLSEIVSVNGDVVCLQEVEALQFRDFFAPNMGNHGYDGIFQPKSRARTMEDISRVDGCAIFWKRSTFTLVEETLIEFQQLANKKQSELREAGDAAGLDRLMLKDNIALIALLQFTDRNHSGPGRLLVANTHIHWDPQYSDVKLIQTLLFLEEVATIRDKHMVGHNGDVSLPVIVMGDFNSLPDSGVYELVTKGTIGSDHSDLRKYNYGNYSAKGSLAHKLPLKSCYAQLPSGEPEFSNFTHEFVGVLDYIFYESDCIRVSSVLKPLLESEVLPYNGALPNPFNSSDHTMLFATLLICPTPIKGGNKKGNK